MQVAARVRGGQTLFAGRRNDRRRPTIGRFDPLGYRYTSSHPVALGRVSAICSLLSTQPVAPNPSDSASISLSERRHPFISDLKELWFW